jgi:16S rRNA (adenine1518-N6/adenine1519-N6)-dimethyltransferase
MSSLPSLKSVIDRHKLFTRKALGQHFLLDENLLHKIVRHAGNLKGVNAIEVGPGPGGLTRALLNSDAASVHVIEKDDRCIAALEELREAYLDRLIIHHQDALEVDLISLAPPPRAIVANLPYNIATVLLIRWLKEIYAHGAVAYQSLTLMFQKEVATRLVAEPGTKDYGRLSIITQWLCSVRKDFDIPPGVFLPPPKVMSTLVTLTPRPKPLFECDMETLEKVVAAAFGQRRKMLRQALKPLRVDTEALLNAAGIDPTLRAEQVDMVGFGRLVKSFINISQ